MFSFVETKRFTRLVQEYLSEAEYMELQSFLIEHPAAGDIIPGSGLVQGVCANFAGARRAEANGVGTGSFTTPGSPKARCGC